MLHCFTVSLMRSQQNKGMWHTTGKHMKAANKKYKEMRDMADEGSKNGKTRKAWVSEEVKKLNEVLVEMVRSGKLFLIMSRAGQDMGLNDEIRVKLDEAYDKYLDDPFDKNLEVEVRVRPKMG